jgi:hypothetical protein
LAGQPGHHRGQHFGEVGAKDEVGVADLLAPPLDFLGGGRWVIREYGQRVRLPERSRIGVSHGRHERGDAVSDDWDVEGELDVPNGTEVPCQTADVGASIARKCCERDRVGDFDG